MPRILRVHGMLHIDQNMLCCPLGRLSAVPGWADITRRLSAARQSQSLGRPAETGLEGPSLFRAYSRPVRELRGDRRAGHEPAQQRLKEVRKFPWTRVPGSRPAEASRGRARRLSLLEESRVRGMSAYGMGLRGLVPAPVLSPVVQAFWNCTAGYRIRAGPNSNNSRADPLARPRVAYFLGRQRAILTGAHTHTHTVPQGSDRLGTDSRGGPCFPSRH